MRGNTVINYVIASEYCIDKIIEFKVEERVDSDDMMVRMNLKREKKNKEEK